MQVYVYYIKLLLPQCKDKISSLQTSQAVLFCMVKAITNLKFWKDRLLDYALLDINIYKIQGLETKACKNSKFTGNRHNNGTAKL